MVALLVLVRTTRNTALVHPNTFVHIPSPRRVASVGKYTARWCSSHDNDKQHDTSLSEQQQAAKDALTVLSRRGKTGRRLGQVVELACSFHDDSIDLAAKTATTTSPRRTVADIGCDHGMLAFALAVTGTFDQVIGGDVSEQALQGARTLQEQVMAQQQTSQQQDNNDKNSGSDSENVAVVDLRVGNGLSVLPDGTDPSSDDITTTTTICIAGMGINTMASILQKDELRRVGCQRLVLQPTNSRPRNLLSLYDHLYRLGWTVQQERILFLSSRWYLTALFETTTGNTNNGTIQDTNKEGAVASMRRAECTIGSDTAQQVTDMPGSCLPLDDLGMQQVYKEYVSHHLDWLQRDMMVDGLERPERLQQDDLRWMEAMQQKQVDTGDGRFQ